MEYFIAKYNYWIYVFLMLIGLYAMIAKNNLAKKIIGMNIFQTAIIVFYVSIGAKRGATIPIIEHGAGHEGAEAAGAAGAAGAEVVNGAVQHGTEMVESAVHHGAEAVEGAAHAVEGAAHAVEGVAHEAAGLADGAAHAIEAVAAHAAPAIDAVNYINPLPHVLMLTAIVVSVSTLGVALAIMMGVYKRYGTLEEDEILEQIRK